MVKAGYLGGAVTSNIWQVTVAITERAMQSFTDISFGDGFFLQPSGSDMFFFLLSL